MMEQNWPGDGWAISCDTCSNEAESEMEAWANAWASFKALGWRAFMIGGEWEHRCPACAIQRITGMVTGKVSP